ncbi:hypothetical protein ABT294_00610 [Nonomuraea sp. NPDC000554]|uniref:hypothetical protein n=1 Tax=Nonomuraea sp. NPDC000554 TaxID=3154259 RepID=UPI00332440D7
MTMLVTATEDFTFFYNLVPVRVAKGEEISSDIAAYLLRIRAAVEPADDEARSVVGPFEPEPVQESPPADEDVLNIDGTISAILIWVGDDQERAAQAREAESARDKPRSTLISQLDEILGR